MRETVHLLENFNSYSLYIIIAMQNFIQWDTVQKEERQASEILEYRLFITEALEHLQK